MVKAREWSQKTREEVIALHKNGNGYKKIAKLLNIPRDTIGSIIRKFKLKGTVETLPGRGRKKILTATAVRYLKRNVEKNPRVTAKELKKDLSDVGTEVSAQTIRRALHNEDLHARTPRRTPLLTPKNKKSRLQYAKSHVDKPQSRDGVPRKGNFVSSFIESGFGVKGVLVQVSPLSAPATRVVISNVPPFIKNELARFGKFASAMKMIPLGCKSTAVKHVLSFRRQVFMFLASCDQHLDISFRCKHGDSSYVVFASTERLRCFECGDIGHKQFGCPHRAAQRADQQAGSSGGSVGEAAAASGPDRRSVPACAAAGDGVTGPRAELATDNSNRDEGVASDSVINEQNNSSSTNAVEPSAGIHRKAVCKTDRPVSEDAGPALEQPEGAEGGVHERMGDVEEAESDSEVESVLSDCSGLSEIRINKELSQYNQDAILVLGGDWNCTLDFTMDRTGDESHMLSVNVLKGVVTDNNLVDCWRIKHPTLKQFTWLKTVDGEITLIPLGCKSAALKHILYFRRQVFMFLNSADKTLEVPFRVSHGEGSYMVYISMDCLKCFQCGVVGHKQLECPSIEKSTMQGAQASSAADTSRAPVDWCFEDPGEGSSATPASGVGRDLDSVSGQQQAGPGGSEFGEQVEGQGEVHVGSVDSAQVTSEVVSEVNGGLMMAGLYSKESGAREREVVNDSQLSLAVSLEEDRMSEVSDFGGSQCSGELLYSVDQINPFLDETKGGSVENGDFFPDLDRRRIVMWTPCLSGVYGGKGNSFLVMARMGQVLVLNNLWHKFTVLNPPGQLITDIQRMLVDFFWGGQHWLRAAVLYLPAQEGGKGLIDIRSRVAVLRLQATQRLLYGGHLSWMDVACALLRVAGRLGLDRHLFSLQLETVDLGGLTFCLAAIEAWQIPGGLRTSFLGNGISKVRHLRRGVDCVSAEQLAEMGGFRSVRLASQGQGLLLSQEIPTLGHFSSLHKNSMYRAYTKALNFHSLRDVRKSKWTGVVRADSSLKGSWRSLYKRPIEKRVEHFTLNGPRGRECQSPSAVTLFCHLSPEFSAVTMEIRWFKGTDCVCLYKNRQVTEGRGFEGRVRLFTQELQRGNVSLQIRDCRQSDEGDYLCQVTNEDTTQECTEVIRKALRHSASDLAPTATALFNKEKQELKFLKEKLEWQNEKIEELQKERDFLLKTKKETMDKPVSVSDSETSSMSSSSLSSSSSSTPKRRKHKSKKSTARQPRNTRKCTRSFGNVTLLHYRNRPNNTINDELRETLRGFGLLRQPDPQTAASPEAGSRKRGHRKRCTRPQKHGKRAGVRTRLTSKPVRAALPSILLSNVCSLENKLDCIRLQRTTRRESRDCCVFVFTETWLSDRVPDAAIQLDGLASFRADRDSALCGKTRGGGLCVYINTEWCKNSVLVSSYCSPLVEFMIVRCRPFYLPREFTAVLIISVYIPPGATAKDALCELYSAISGLQNTHPDGLFIVAGDFNHVNLKSVLPKFHQHVNFATRGANALDLVYTNIPSAYRAEPRPHLGYSDHISVMLIPAYRPLVRRSKPVLKQVRTWPSGAISALQDCFEHTDWQMFREAATYSTTTDLEEYTSSVTSYIGKCIDDVTVSKTITTRPNQKPWMTAEVRALLKARDSAFKAGDKAALRKARAKLSRGIREAKRAHGQSIHSHFRDSGDTRRMWQGIQAITNYRTTPPACDSDASLPDALNHFYARFETQNSVEARKTTPPPDDQVLCLTAADVRKTLRRVNPRKAAGPDNIPARVLRECADQLTDVFTDIFNISLSSATVPTCLKATTIIPVPKKSSVSCLNDYRPIALTPIIMKCFERLVLRHIKTLLPPSLDPLQFAYRPNHSTDDAISTTLHLALTHLDNRDTYVRMLFIDFSSAFNTIIPQHLIGKLNLLGLNTSLSNWILDFLTGRPESVRIGHNTYSTTTLSTGAPQGCVLSPLLFTLLTHDCAAMHSSNHIIKFADDTTVVGLINKNDESAYREEVQRLTDWCRTNNLSLNVDKTKEMFVDFRRTRRDHSPIHIDGSTVEIVNSTKFLGVHLAEDLTWSLNTSTITKKAQQRLYFLRRLRKKISHLPSSPPSTEEPSRAS
ncbi:hypothetical protein NFI96_008195 [Prochilodus magdalenae]|nr:hypothetical protein NFI96_008195 [Prochilodus magdalenae]